MAADDSNVGIGCAVGIYGRQPRLVCRLHSRGKLMFAINPLQELPRIFPSCNMAWLGPPSWRQRRLGRCRWRWEWRR